MQESEGEGWPERLSREVRKTSFMAIGEQGFLEAAQIEMAVGMAQINRRESSEEKYFGENWRHLS